MGSIYVICSRQCPNGDGIYTLLYALYKYSTSITNQPTNQAASYDKAHWGHMGGLASYGVLDRMAGSWRCDLDM